MSASGLEKSYMGLRGRSLNTAVSVIATTGFVLFGYDQGVMSGIISADPFNNYFPNTKGDDYNASVYRGFVTAIYEAGCLLGAGFILWAGDSLGRRKSMMLGGLVMILGVIIQVTPVAGYHATAQFIIGRTITGVGNGINTSSIPTYQAECSRTTNRGLLICIEGGVIAFGSMVAYWVDYGASYGSDDFTWRFPIAFQIVFGIILCVGMFFMPESPRWLLSKNRQEEGLAVIAALLGVSEDSPEALLQKTNILDSIAASGGGTKTPFKVVLTNGKTQHFRRMLLGASSQFMQQIGGCNAVIYYLPILLVDSIKVSHETALLVGGGNMIVYAAFATTSWFIIERAGRRKLFLIGSIGQGLSMVLTFACLIPNSPAAGKGAVVGLFTYIAFFGATWLPLPWLYPAEINPLKTRIQANAISTMVNWGFNFLIVMVVPIMITSIGWGTYLFFAVMNACFIPFIYFFYPETKRRSLEEIDLIFAKGFVENMSYIRAAKELPLLDERGIEEMSRRYELVDRDIEQAGSNEETASKDEKSENETRTPSV